MAPWEEVGGTILHRASSAGHLRGACCFLGDVAYASAEEWRRSTPGEVLPELFSSSGTFEERRRAKRFEIMQSIIDNPRELDKCRSCHLLEKKRRGERKNYFIELEHLRRAVHKMLDHCAAIMSPHAFIVLRESLQLGVRFLTDFSEEKEVQPGDSRPVSPATAVKANAEESQDIAALEEEIQSLSEENARLRKELMKLGIMDPTRLGIRSGKGVLSVEVQTEPVLIGTSGGAGVPNYGGMASSRGELSYDSSLGQAPSGRAPGAARQRLKGGQVVGDDDDNDPSDDNAAPAIARGRKGTAAKRCQKAGKLGGGGESVLERDLARAKDELEVMRRKLAASERELNEEKKKAQALAASNAGTPGGSAQAPGSGTAGTVGTAGTAANDGVDGRGDADGSSGAGNTSGRGRGRGRSARGRGQHHGPGGYGPGSEGKLHDAFGGGDVPPEECAHEDWQAFARRSSGSLTPSRAKPVMVDKCVGGGPEPPTIPQLQGRSLKEKPSPELELNKNAHTFQRSLRAQPSLGMSFSSASNLAATTPPGPGNKATASSASTGSASRKRPGLNTKYLQQGTGAVPTAAASAAASAASIASASSKALHRIGPLDLAARSFAAGSAVVSGFPSGGTCAADAADASTADGMMCEAEPYLLQVWEQHPDSHKKPAEELMRLGALTPAPPLVNIAVRPECPL